MYVSLLSQGLLKSVFRVNTPEGYEALNLESNGKNKYNIILSIGEDKVTKDATLVSLKYLRV
jgi:hypothetical protein